MSVPLYVRAMPRRLVSRAVGFLARRRVPGFVLRPALRAYCRRFDVDLSEAAAPLEAYRTFTEFFTRPLREGSRPPDPDPAAVVSPVDARVYASGRVEAGMVLQCKDVPYAVADLLGDPEAAAALEGGTYLTAYLSPRDYHRIHWPLGGRLRRVRHLPGDLWPVNDRALHAVRGLFCRNERVALFCETDAGAPFALVPVGALNVGSIGLEFAPLRTNRLFARRPRDVAAPLPLPFERGGRAAWFAFGSAVVLLLSRAAGTLDPLEPGTPLRLNRRIGTRGPAGG